MSPGGGAGTPGRDDAPGEQPSGPDPRAGDRDPDREGEGEAPSPGPASGTPPQADPAAVPAPAAGSPIGPAPRPGPEDPPPPSAADSLALRISRIESLLSQDVRPEPTSEGQVGPYRLVRRLGAGGMGVVWMARDDRLGRDVALKLLAEHLTVDREAVRRFGQEAAAAARLDHPGIVGVHDAGEHDGRRYLVMELVDGAPLDGLLEAFRGRDASRVRSEEVRAAFRTQLALLARTPGENGPWREEESQGSWVRLAALWGSEIADALAHAHRRGVLHRDVKPSNVLIDRAGRPRIVDFGLARLEDSADATRTGVVLGTLAYMAPETVAGDRDGVDGRADVYSFGATLHEMLSLRPFRESASRSGFLERIREVRAPSLRTVAPAVPADLAAIVSKCVEHDREDRYGSCDDVADDLRRFLDGTPVRARGPGTRRRVVSWARRHPWRAAAAVTLVVAGLASGPVVQRVTVWSARRDAAAEVAFAVRRAADADAADRERISVLSRLTAVEATATASDTRSRAHKTTQIRSYESQVAANEREAGRARFEARLALERALAVENASGGVTEPTRTAAIAFGLARLAAARDAEDETSAAEFAEFVNRLDTAGAHTATVRGLGRLVVDCAEPGTSLFLFRRTPVAELTRDPVIPRDVWVPVRPDGTPDTSPVGGIGPSDPALEITEVLPGTAAERAGLRAGDLVTAIDGLPVAGVYVASAEPRGPAARLGVRDWMPVENLEHHTIEDEDDWRRACAPPDGEIVRGLLVRGIHVSLTGSRPAEEAAGISCLPVRKLVETAAPARPVDLQVIRRGVPATVRLDAGERLGVRCAGTVAPLLATGACRFVPGAETTLPPGSYLVFARAAGRADARHPVRIRPLGRAHIRTNLIPHADVPPDAVPVPAGNSVLGGASSRFSDVRDVTPVVGKDVPAFMIRRFEVTVAEYFEFLNDPENSAAIAAEPLNWIYAPRGGSTPALFARRDASGRWVSPLPGDAPIASISLFDMQAWIDWRNARARAAGERWVFRLPTRDEWERAARGADGRRYPWGDRFDAALCVNQCREPDARSDFPCGFAWSDESPFGVHDLAGSVQERTGGTIVLGGAWGESDVPLFRAANALSLGEGTVSPQIGLRLVVEPNPDAPPR